MANRRTVVIFLDNQEKAIELASHLHDDAHAAHVAQNTDDVYRLANSANLADNRNATRGQLLNQMLAQLGVTSADDVRLCMAEAVSNAVESAKLFLIPTSDAVTLRRLVA